MHPTQHRLALPAALFAGLLCLASVLPAAPPRSADAMLDHVIAQLPSTPVSATGTIFVRQRRGIPIATYGFTLDAHWQSPATSVSYTILTADGTPLESLVFQPAASEIFTYRQGPQGTPAPLPDLTANIARTDVSWLDLTLYFLWWRGARYAGEDTVRGFHCHIIEVDAPTGQAHGTYASVRLWISSEQGLLLQAEGRDKDGNPIRRLWVQSVRQIGEQWMIHTLEIQQSDQIQRTRLQVVDVTTCPDDAP